MVLGSLAVHLHIHHGKSTGGRWHWGTIAPGGEPRTYKMDLPTAGPPPRNCPVKRYQGRAATRTSMQVNFLHQHVQDAEIIMEEGNLPPPQCPQCNILVPCWVLNRRYPATAQCANGAERKR